MKKSKLKQDRVLLKEKELDALRRRPLLAVTCNGSFPASDPPSYWASAPIESGSEQGEESEEGSDVS